MILSKCLVAIARENTKHSPCSSILVVNISNILKVRNEDTDTHSVAFLTSHSQKDIKFWLLGSLTWLVVRPFRLFKWLNWQNLIYPVQSSVYLNLDRQNHKAFQCPANSRAGWCWALIQERLIATYNIIYIYRYLTVQWYHTSSRERGMLLTTHNSDNVLTRVDLLLTYSHVLERPNQKWQQSFVIEACWCILKRRFTCDLAAFLSQRMSQRFFLWRNGKESRQR